MAENKNDVQVTNGPTCMSSVNRIAHLPVVESSFQTANTVYEKVKDFNGMTKGVFQTIEQTVSSAVETGKPYASEVCKKLDGPIKTVDNVLNTGLNYVESKVPAVKLPPSEIFLQIYNSTKDYVNETMAPRVDAAYKSIHGVVDPAVNMAKPTVEKAYKIVEPMVQPAVERAQQLREYGQQKVEEYLHGNDQTNNGIAECLDCQKDAKMD